MNRRKFLTRLLQVGLLATTASASASIPKFKKYPEITYSRDYVIEKMAFLHTLHAVQGDSVWYVAEYSDGKFLDDYTIKLMFKEIKATLDKDK